MKHLLLSAIVYLLFSFNGNSTHVIGATLEYEHISNDNFAVKLTLRSDCGPWAANNLQDTALITLQDATGFEMDLYIDRISSNDISTIESTDTCNYSFQKCIRITEYYDTLTMPTNTIGFYIKYQICCRPFSLINLVNPGNSETAVYTYIPPTSNMINNSAKWNYEAPISIPVETNQQIDFSATDPDGDSLVYSLFTPLDVYWAFNSTNPTPNNLAYNHVDWEVGYSELNPFNNDNFHMDNIIIDPVTGVVSGIMHDIGTFALGIKCDEYRNGTKINTVFKDISIDVVSLYSTDFNANQTCSNEIKFINNSIVADDSCIWNFGDGSPDFATLNSDTVYHQFPSTNTTYDVLLITSPNTACADTLLQAVTLDSFSIDLILPDTIYVSDPAQLEVSHQLDSTFELIDWEINQSLNFTTLSDTTLTLNPGYNYITAEMSNDAGCTISTSDSILVLDTPALDINFDINNSSLIDTLYLTSTASNLSSIEWSSNGDGVFLPDNTSMNVKYALGTTDKLDSSVVIFLNGNIYTRSSLVDSIAFDFHASNFSTSTNLTVNETVSFYEQVPNMMPITTWKWKFGNGDESTISNPTYVYTSSNNYMVTLEANNENEYFITSKNIFIDDSDLSISDALESSKITFINTPTIFSAVKESDDNLEIQVVSSIGQVIRKDEFITNFSINKEELSAGLFLVVIKNQEGEFISRRFVVN